MDLEKYKSNPKTRYLAQALESMGDEEQKKLLIAQMDKILKDDEEGEEFPGEIVLETRAGVGGEEAALFARELADMYRAYASRQGWSVQTL